MADSGSEWNGKNRSRSWWIKNGNMVRKTKAAQRSSSTKQWQVGVDGPF